MKLLCKDAFIWTPTMIATFQELKEAFIRPTVLQLPELNLTFELQIDASGMGINIVFLHNQHPLHTLVSSCMLCYSHRQRIMCTRIMPSQRLSSIGANIYWDVTSLFIPINKVYALFFIKLYKHQTNRSG